MDQGTELKKISAKLSKKCGSLKFDPPVFTVYNPLEYAKKAHSQYLELYAGSAITPNNQASGKTAGRSGSRSGSVPKKVIFLGMNPGPWGMAQTGIPFGEISIVKEWLGIEEEIKKPATEHPKRPILGFNCTRSEVSGRRLWGLFKEYFGSPENFFKNHYVANYCPLVFMNEGGANLTPDKLPKQKAEPLYNACDIALAETINIIKPQWLIGVGAFAEKRIKLVKDRYFPEGDFSITRILHPSPASPKANLNWKDDVVKTLEEEGIWPID